LYKNSARMFEELAKVLNVSKSIVFVYTQWKRLKKRGETNEFYMNCLNWLFKIV